MPAIKAMANTTMMSTLMPSKMPVAALRRAGPSHVASAQAETTAAPIIRRFGYKRILVWNALLTSVFVAACALFTAATPSAVILTVLLIGGFFRSLQFTAVNSIAYADIGEHDMSKATSFASVAQQLSMSAGVAVGAFVLEIERMGRETNDVVASDFIPAFLVVAALAASSALIFMRLPKDAGLSLSRKAHAIGTPERQDQAQKV